MDDYLKTHYISKNIYLKKKMLLQIAECKEINNIKAFLIQLQLLVSHK